MRYDAQELKENYTIILVTHSLHQAARTSDMTAFLNLQLSTPTASNAGVRVPTPRLAPELDKVASRV